MSTLSTGAGVDLTAVLLLTDDVPEVTDTVGTVLGLGLGSFTVFTLRHLLSTVLRWSCEGVWVVLQPDMKD